MSKTAKTAELSFEQAIERLESIVDSMEGDELALETMITRYEEGSRLVEQCKAKLNDAELKIQQLEKRASGAVEAKPFALEPGSGGEPANR